jgi:hypothetical protein
VEKVLISSKFRVQGSKVTTTETCSIEVEFLSIVIFTPCNLICFCFIGTIISHQISYNLHESEAFICKALKGEAIVQLLRVLNNAADECIRLALRVKIDEK